MPKKKNTAETEMRLNHPIPIPSSIDTSEIAIKVLQDAVELLTPEEAKDLYDKIVARCGGKLNRHREYFRGKKENPFAEALDAVLNFHDSFATIASIQASEMPT